MTDEISPSELGAFTNNLPNKEGIKKLCEMVNSGTESQGYTKAETDALLAEKQDVLTAGFGISIIEGVISASDEWEVVPTNEYGSLFNEIEITKDVFMIFADYKRYNGFLYFPKGTLLTGNVKMPVVSTSYSYTSDEFNVMDFNYGNLFSNSSSSITGSRRKTKITDKTGYYELSINDGVGNNLSYYKRTAIPTSNENFVIAYRRKERE